MYVSVIDFAEWLRLEMDKAGVSQAELSRRSGISPSQISKILSMQSAPGKVALMAIADALRLPSETVFIAAGMIRSKPEDTPTLEEVNHKLSLLPEDQQRQVLEYIDFLLERGNRGADTGRPLAPSRR